MHEQERFAIRRAPLLQVNINIISVNPAATCRSSACAWLCFNVCHTNAGVTQPPCNADRQQE
jgi:hypothetical protein